MVAACCSVGTRTLVRLALVMGILFCTRPAASALVAVGAPEDEADDVGACDEEPAGRAITPPGSPRLPRLERACEAGGSSAGIARGDFDCDGRADLAVGVPGDSVTVGSVTTVRAGAVNVVYQSPATNRLSPARNQLWHQGLQRADGRVIGTPAADDQFGASLAAGDFNGDGCSDLAIGVPGEEVFVPSQLTFPLRVFARFDNAGAVNVLYGKPGEGLTAAFNEYLTQGFSSLSSPAQARADFPDADDRFGSSLAWGDFNDDGAGELAVGVPFEDVVTAAGATVANAGAVVVFIGLSNPAGVRGPTGPGGLNGGTLLVQQDTQAMQLDFFNPRLPGVAEAGDQLGQTVTSGDFNGDGFSDLAIGVRGEDLTIRTGAVSNAGAVNVVYGGPNWLDALTPLRSQFWHQASSRIGGSAEAGDLFGSALAAGNFNGDNFVDLAIGVPTEDDGAIRDAGAVNVIFGSTAGVSTDFIRNFFLTQDSDPQFDFGDEIVNQSEPGDRFGSALAAGNFDGDGFDDLAIGAPFQDLRDFVFEPTCLFRDFVDAGAVTIVYGNNLFMFGRSQFLFQGGKDARTQPRFQGGGAHFGSSLTAWNFGASANTDLAVGVPGASLRTEGGLSVFAPCTQPGRTTDTAGAVEVLYGPLDLASPANQSFHQASEFPSIGTSLQGLGELGDGFGRALY